MKNIALLFTQCKEIAMTPKEKKKVWATIVANTFNATSSTTYVRKSDLPRLNYRGLLPEVMIRSLYLTKKKYMLGIIASTIIVSGSLSAFAQESLPGDILYPVKTNVNEKIKIAFAFTPKAKAITEAVLATKRLEEVEKLTLEGKLSPHLIQQTNTSFAEHVHIFETYLAKLENKSDFKTVAKIGVFFQTRVAVHINILNEIEGNSSTSTVVDSQMIAPIKKEVLSAVVQTVIVTRKAVTKISTDSQEEVINYKNINNQHIVPLDINHKEAQKYLKELHDEVGSPVRTIENISTPLVPMIVQ